jgi:FkbM family methyltransferase
MRLLTALTQLNRLPEVRLCRAATPNWPKLTAAYLGLPVKFPFDVQLNTGKFHFATFADVRTFWCVFFSQLYDVKRTDRVIVDAGANIGTFTLYALLKAPDSHVIAIEPAPDTCDRLRRVIHEHGFSGRCTIHQAALGPQTGTTTIDLGLESQFRSTGTGGTTVPVLTLDSAVSALPAAAIDMFKIDVEGAEYFVLPSETATCLERVQRMTMEFHPNGSVSDLFVPLESKGLKRIAVRDDGGGYGIARFERA